MTNDGVADDGPMRRDNVMPDVEVLNGGGADDALGAGPSGTVFNLESGDDHAAGGPGDDLVLAAVWGPDPNPSLPSSLHPQGRDTVTCGAGRDAVVADAGDVAAPDCEVVGRDGPTVRGQPGYELRGSSASETIVLSRIIDMPWAPVLVRGGGGNDTLIGGAEVSGGTGSDRLIKVDGQRQSFRGDSANDRIDARDQSPAKQANDDSIRCGPGRDKVYADAADRVSRDCERVLR
jgi:Ca2+-binding RTX toxin-like protein